MLYRLFVTYVISTIDSAPREARYLPELDEQELQKLCETYDV